MARGHGADAVEDVLRQSRAGDGMDDDVGIGQDVVYGTGDLVRNLPGALEGDVAGESDGNVGEVAIAGAAGAVSRSASTVLRASRVLTNTMTPATNSAAMGSASKSQVMPNFLPRSTRASPKATTPLDQMSVEKCRASACKAWLSYLFAIFPRARERQKSTAMETSIARNAASVGSIST